MRPRLMIAIKFACPLLIDTEINDLGWPWAAFYKRTHQCRAQIMRWYCDFYVR